MIHQNSNIVNLVPFDCSWCLEFDNWSSHLFFRFLNFHLRDLKNIIFGRNCRPIQFVWLLFNKLVVGDANLDIKNLFGLKNLKKTQKILLAKILSWILQNYVSYLVPFDCSWCFLSCLSVVMYVNLIICLVTDFFLDFLFFLINWSRYLDVFNIYSWFALS